MSLLDLPPDTVLTANELATLLRMHTTTILKYASQGEIPCIKLGRSYRFQVGAINDWLRNQSTKSGADETAL